MDDYLLTLGKLIAVLFGIFLAFVVGRIAWGLGDVIIGFWMS